MRKTNINPLDYLIHLIYSSQVHSFSKTVILLYFNPIVKNNPISVKFGLVPNLLTAVSVRRIRLIDYKRSYIPHRRAFMVDNAHAHDIRFCKSQGVAQLA